MSEPTKGEQVAEQWFEATPIDRNNLWLCDRIDKAIAEAVAAERERVIALIRKRWTFDKNQQHTHNWHALQDTIKDIEAGK